MKQKHKIVILCFCFLLKTKAQNLVSNSSFENYSSCPYDYSQVYFCSPWFQPNVINGNVINSSSTDYFNSCTTNTSIGVPLNFGGYQLAHSGGAYVGINCYTNNSNSIGREYLETRLNNTLLSGKKYNISLYVSLANNSKYSTNTIGVYFSNDSIIYSSAQYNNLSVTPQVINPSTNNISDTLNWMLISGTYIAQGSERFMTIGNFAPNGSSNIDTINISGNPFSYYYIDDVSVYPDSLTGVKDLEDAGIKFKLYPNPANEIINVELKMLNFESLILNGMQVTLTIKNTMGQIVHKSEIKNRKSEINLSQLKSEMYFYELREKNNLLKTGKLVIIK